MVLLGFPTPVDSSAAELINLRKILESCVYVPDIPDGCRASGVSREQRFCFALDRFDSTAKIFDQAYFESDVLRIGTTEHELDARLQSDARDIGVPDAHFPSAKRRRVHRLSRQSPHRRNDQNHASWVTEQKGPAFNISAKALPPPPPSWNVAPPPSWTVAPPPPSWTVAPCRPSSFLPPARQASVVDANTPESPTPAQSILSFKSSSSRSSWISGKFPGKRRDSLMHFFRRGAGSRHSFVSQSPVSPPMDYACCGAEQRTITEEPEFASPRSQVSQGRSSGASLAPSSRTSVSSVVETQTWLDMSGSDREKIESLMRTETFAQLKALCLDELQRFNSFALDSHIALPLILGRNLVYSEERRQLKLAQLQQQHNIDMERMEDGHAAKELEVRDILRMTMEQKAGHNATALRHVANRIELLGDEATAEDYHRLQIEQTALERLERKQEVELRNIVRYQESKKLELLRKQEKELEEQSQLLMMEFESTRREKSTQLQSNKVKLEDLIEERRARMVARWFLRLQILKMMSSDTACIEAALPLSLLGLPNAMVAAMGYS